MKQLYLYVFTLITTISPFVLSASVYSDGGKYKAKAKSKVKMTRDTVAADSVVIYDADPTKSYLGSDSVVMLRLSTNPFVTLHQYLKGHVPGLYVQETSGEPGTIKQGSLVRGITHPVLNAKDFEKNKPLIIVNGVQLLDDPSIVYDVQDYSTQPIGAATSLQSIFEMDNIESIKVLKDYATAAIYGPRAVNGVIYITTKNAKAGERKLSVNGYTGFSAPSSVTTINAAFEKNFRRPFYDQYATQQQLAAFPAYLSDSSNVNFYGPSNWTDLYYEVTPVFSLNGSLSGGSERSNFRFFGGHTSNTGAADKTNLKKYHAAFYLNMLPTKWMTISSMLQMSRMERGRNKSVLERLSETRFLPDLSTPLAPNKDSYGLFLKEYDKVIDDNITSSLLGSIAVNFQLLKNLNFTPRLSIDYNENKRNVFWPTTIMSGNNYVSNYLGYNERLSFDNALTYNLTFENNTELLFEGGFNYYTDGQKYNYGVGYRGPNDFIKVNVVEGNSQKDKYLESVGFIPYYYSDRIKQKLASAYGKFTYSADYFKIGALIRRDGSSYIQPDSRWFTSYAIDAEYNLNHNIKSDLLDHLKVFGSYGRLGNNPFNDREAAGPQYTSDLGWNGNKSIFSYNGIGTISRPYYSGWVGYDIPWSYTDMLNMGIDVSIGKQFTIRAEYYNKHAKDMLFSVPTVAESGYQFDIVNGMSVKNTGVDLTLGFNSNPSGNQSFTWNSSLNIAYNTNKLTAVPNGATEIEVGNRKLMVGQRIDQFWLLENQGKFVNDMDVPVDPQSFDILTYNGGTAFKGGDPRWLDVNGDYTIDNKDRILKGNIIPKYVGGFYNQFVYNKFDLSFLLYFNLDKQIINSQAAKYYDFANNDETNSLSSVRDITFWEKNFDESKYPMYNPWSSVIPYQAEQDMFMEDGSFLKLRNLSVGYDLTSIVNSSKEKFSRFYLYMTANNLLTITKYSGRDPELVDFYGYDTGAGIRIPKTFTMGIKLDF